MTSRMMRSTLPVALALLVGAASLTPAEAGAQSGGGRGGSMGGSRTGGAHTGFGRSFASRPAGFNNTFGANGFHHGSPFKHPFNRFPGRPFGRPFGAFGSFGFFGAPVVYGTSCCWGSGYWNTPAYADPPAYYAPAVAYSSPGPAAIAPPVPAPPMQTVVEFPTGRYELRGDGFTAPYTWIWIPAAPTAPPTPPADPGAFQPSSGAPPREVYRWTDGDGVLHVTDRLAAVPARYRPQAKQDAQPR